MPFSFSHALSTICHVCKIRIATRLFEMASPRPCDLHKDPRGALSLDVLLEEGITLYNDSHYVTRTLPTGRSNIAIICKICLQSGVLSYHSVIAKRSTVGVSVTTPTSYQFRLLTKAVELLRARG